MRKQAGKGQTVSKRRRRNARPPLEVETELLAWGPRGSTLAALDERRVLVDRGIPGELVRASVQRTASPWRGVVDSVLEPSDARVAPPCPHYAQGCGGCQWQHVSYTAQIEAKRSLLEREMRSAGLDLMVDAIHVMDDPWRYRHTAALALGWEAGFRPRGRRGIVDVQDCPISHPLIGLLSSQLNDLLRSGRLPNYHGKVWLDCTVVGTRTAPHLQVLIQGITGLTEESNPELPRVAAVLGDLPHVRSVAYRHRSGEPRPLIGPLLDEIEVDGRMYCLPAGSFFQTNLDMLARVVKRMRREIEPLSLRSAADIYGGVGALGLPLADCFETLTLVELDSLAVEAARSTAASWGLRNLRFVSRHAERALPDLLDLDMAIVDPPRSGLGDVVTKALGEARAPLILYLSCSPASLARDLAGLTVMGYNVKTIEMFDFYPQTYHVESLTILCR